MAEIRQKQIKPFALMTQSEKAERIDYLWSVVRKNVKSRRVVSRMKRLQKSAYESEHKAMRSAEITKIYGQNVYVRDDSDEDDLL